MSLWTIIFILHPPNIHMVNLITIWSTQSGLKAARRYIVWMTIVVPHGGLFLYVNLGYASVYHDGSILWRSSLYKIGVHIRTRWWELPMHYWGCHVYGCGDSHSPSDCSQWASTWCVSQCYWCIQQDVCNTRFMRSGTLKIWRESLWGWWSDSMLRNPKYTRLFRSSTHLINFLHQRMMDLFQDILGNRVDNPEVYGWEGDY